MEDKKVPPPPQQQQGRPALSYVQHPQQPVQQCADTKYPRIVQYMLSPVEVQQEMRRPPSGPYPQSAGPRSPLLENHQELYGTKQDSELARQYALRERAQMLQRAERHQQRSYPAATPVTDPVLSAPVPPGFNASVHQAYLRRNPHQLDQIYQNHQNVYQSPTQPRAYQPYTSRIQQSNFTGSGQSHPQILKQQYDELQQMKIQQQIQYQNQAQLQQQQTFAQRQILHQHLHSRQQSQQNLSQYDSLHSMQQRDLQNMEMNVRSNHKNDDYSPEDYAFNHPVAKPMQNQMLQSPNYNHSANSTMNSAKSAFENSSSPSSKSPSGSESRKSSSGTGQALRSPVAQRPPSAPVTMAGWLYKQGSDGLKVWRKRWFVLSEYCLFYYKGQEEDKLLGSVLLPSYRVSGCTSEDKVLRKFAFKCEHANMRTYILAAPDREQMHQWTKALTLATLMQEGSSNNKHNQTKENHPTRNMENVTKPSNNVDQDEIAPEIVSGVQPMYENAPPKPRRSNEGYSSPSPERSMEKNDPTFDLENSSYNNNSAQKISSLKSKSSLQKENIYGSKTNNDTRNYSSQNYVSKSPEGIYNSQNLSLPLTNTATHRLERNKSPFNYQENTLNKFDRPEDRLIENKSPAYAENRNATSHNNPYHQIYPKDRQNIYEESQYHQQMQQQECNSEIIRDQFIQDQDFGHGYQQYHISTGLEKQTFERRTPDTYGRSVVVPGYYNKGRSGDYEDVYNNLSSGVDDPNYGEITYRRPLSPMSYERRKISSMQNQQRYGSTNMENNQQPRPSSSVQVRQKKIPHDLSIPTLAPNSVPRPHSADFLEYESKNPVFDSNSRKQNSNNFSRQPPRPKSSLDINHGDYNGDNYYYSEASYAEKMRQSAQYLRNKGSGTNMLNVRHSNTNPPEYISQRKMSAPTFNVSEGIIESNYDHNVRLNGEPVYGMHDQNKNVNTDNKYSLNEISGPNSNWTLRNKNLSQLVNQDDIYNRSNSAMSETSLSTSGGLTKDQIVENSGEQFIRSASARLPTNNDQISPREGERKVQQREESMKRLLEWKQRMLQSPLTRKSTPATLSLARSLNQTKSIHPTGERYLATSGGQTFPKSHSRTYNQHQTAYNSYSSDDEASVSMTGTETSTRNTGKLLTTKKPFTGSNPTISRGSTRDISIPVRAVSPRVRSSSAQPWNSQSNFDYETWNTQTSGEDNWSTSKSPSRQSNQPIRAVSPRVRRTTDVEEKSTVSPVSPSIHDPLLGVQKFSAGELLGRTHEELVLLLIQLRRKHTAIANSIEQCCTQIQSVQNRINASEFLEQKHENLQRLEQLKHHLMELEKHYEKSKPLVHLVDNMVKLGSLYNRGPGGSVPSTLERLEYNQIIRERALIEQAAEQRRWAESSENLPREHVEKRIEELRAMERWVAGEANTLRGLRRERESLGGPALQHDLSRVHAMLAENSKKLEQTVAGNARLEQELMVLRQKLQQQQSSNGRSNSFSGESGMDSRAAADATALLEDELKRVQQLVVDLQKQRQELSIAVKQLTDKSQNLVLVSPTSGKQTNDYTNFPKESASKVRHNSVWIETDLDNCTFVEHGGGFINHMSSTPSASSIKKLAPLYIDTQSINMNYAIENKDNQLSPNACDEPSINPFGNLINVEKQEIKTVRIVKRESERRQRDREKSLQPGNLDWAMQQQNNTLDQLVEEESNLSPYHNRSASLPRGYPTNYAQNSYCSNYMQDSQQPSKKYVQNDTLSPTNYQYRSQANPPNTLSLTNVNIPFDNMSISSANSGNKYLSSPSLNNNDYLNGYQDSSMHSYTSKYGYVNHNSSNNSLSQQNVLQSIPYFDNTSETMHPMTNGPLSPDLPKNGSINSLNKCNAELSPVFTSEAAKQIIIEMAGEKNGYAKNSNGSLHRRQVPREKRRHYTAPHHIIVKGLENMADDDIFNQEKWWRARDDVDMERVLRGNGLVGSKHGPPPLVAPPDVVRSTLPSGPLPDHYSEHTIDRLLAAPNKIVIPERYIPEKAPELSPEEQKKRREKVESIKKMLTCTTTPSSDPNKSPDSEDKRQREHLLQLNQLLAKQVMEKSKIVAVKALEKLPIDGESSYDSEDLSPEIELPLYQQRDNFFT